MHRKLVYADRWTPFRRENGLVLGNYMEDDGRLIQLPKR